MPIIICGLNHKTAPISVREKVIFPADKLPLYLADLHAHTNIYEAVILSTCNRTELYCDADNIDQVLAWFCQQHPVNRQALEPLLYVHTDEQAIEHTMRVACGIDSMVIGEVQILGQMKAAYSESCVAGMAGPLFNRLFQQVFAVAKEVRTNTSIGACPVSIASAAVGLAKQLHQSLGTVLVIGAGVTIDMVLRHIKPHITQRLVIANRNQENANALAKMHDAVAISLEDLVPAIAVADIVISATGSAVPIITKNMLESALKERSKSITMIDIAMPRDIDESVAELAAVNLFCIDDLKSIIQANLRGREHAAEKANEVIKQKSKELMVWFKSINRVADTIRAYRAQVEEICQMELMKAIKQLQRGEDANAVLVNFGNAFTNKLLHRPSVHMRQAGFEGRFEMLELAQQLFAIPQSEFELI